MHTEPRESEDMMTEHDPAPTENEDEPRLAVRISSDADGRLRLLAAVRKRPMGKLLTELLAQHLPTVHGSSRRDTASRIRGGTCRCRSCPRRRAGPTAPGTGWP